jgi:hypothetical protein
MLINKIIFVKVHSLTKSLDFFEKVGVKYKSKIYMFYPFYISISFNFLFDNLFNFNLWFFFQNNIITNNIYF